jgi:hypothetical protein
VEICPLVQDLKGTDIIILLFSFKKESRLKISCTVNILCQGLRTDIFMMWCFVWHRDISDPVLPLTVEKTISFIVKANTGMVYRNTSRPFPIQSFLVHHTLFAATESLNIRVVNVYFTLVRDWKAVGNVTLCYASNEKLR